MLVFLQNENRGLKEDIARYKSRLRDLEKQQERKIIFPATTN